jgi:predicted TIM-barrel fold metal-dependent hydrolase
MYIDADAHVDENAETWSYVPASRADFRPAEMVFPEGQVPSYLAVGHNDGLVPRGLFIDGELHHRRQRSDELTQTTVEVRELYDVPARLKQMDAIGIDTQIIYPTILLNELTERPEVELALCEAYNRWIADRCRDTGGRLRWTAVLPLRSMPEAIAELRRVKDEGAVAIFKRGYDTDGRRAGDPYFHPLYQVAEELDIPVCIHSGGPYLGYSLALARTQVSLKISLYVQDAFLSLLMSGTCAKFPGLRFGFIEAGSGWVPSALYEANFDTLAKSGANRTLVAARATGDETTALIPAQHYDELLEREQLFVTCEAGENLSNLVGLIGDDNLCVGTDFGHSDRSALIYAHSEIAARDDLRAETKLKLTETNARALYGLR